MGDDLVSLEDIKVDKDYESQGVHVNDFLRGLETKRKNILLLVPTNDDEVRQFLLKYGEAESHPNETNSERRERLIQLVQERGIDLTKDEDQEMNDFNPVGEDVEEEEFYTPASIELIEARKFITSYSINQSKRRLERQSKNAKISMTKQLIERRSEIKELAKIELHGSQLVSPKPISSVSVNPHNTSQILTGTWEDGIKLLNDDLDILKTFPIKGKVSGLDWSPVDSNIFTSSGNSLALWDIEQDLPLTEFDGHESRIVQSKFHPSGRYIASSSFDKTWRLWDIQTKQELLLQEGHSKEVYALAFNNDGNLLVSGGLDALGYVWDLRTGNSIMVLNGHIKPIYSTSWRSNGYQIATGSGDGSIKIWDLRMTKEISAIPAHTKNVSDVKFHNNILISTSYDKTIKFYSNDNWVKINELEGHSDKIMSLDACDKYLVSCGWDRSVKIWK
ncbi:hypothetical protein WICMUC_004129 [Wickerhamomyces mucosus]|uniref:Pre-mRNA processing factor 4 (PRP4)-like domain-containing protein n=1 Tax=Wickerhamomyces mucosus TaxID=1378264 RepID=A0A9P8TAS9_9ASCO|nr:hypothetical protein WICMUC_004129 [Wickerhamomyces mucosus]